MHTIVYFLFMKIDFVRIQHDITMPDKHIIAMIHTHSSSIHKQANPIDLILDVLQENTILLTK
jgi:hypothetical protein